MQFLIRAYDGEGMLEKRMEVRPRHLEGMKKLSNHIISAGGLLDDAGKMKGSALIMDFESGRSSMRISLRSLMSLKTSGSGSRSSRSMW